MTGCDRRAEIDCRGVRVRSLDNKGHHSMQHQPDEWLSETEIPQGFLGQTGC